MEAQVHDTVSSDYMYQYVGIEEDSSTRVYKLVVDFPINAVLVYYIKRFFS